MTDYIDRQAAIHEIHKQVWLAETAKTALVEKLSALPSADAVEIVRCRECKHNPNDTWFECPISHLPYEEDRWCWKGERNDG